MILMNWPEFKTLLDSDMIYSWVLDSNGNEIINTLDGIINYRCILSPTDTDYSDWNTNYKSNANSRIIPVDIDGSQINRPKTTETSFHYEPRCLDFYTSKLNSLYNRKDNGGGILDGTDYGDAGLRFYNSSDIELTQGGAETDAAFQARLDSNCTKTIMWWQATYDMDLIGGMLQLKNQPTSDTYFWCVVAPDIPEGSGGSIPFFASGLNLYFYKDGTMHHYDGRGAKRFVADPVYNSNKFHFIFKHPVGEQVGLQIVVDTFRD